MKKKIVVFGGAFNPPTNGHLSLAEQITNRPEVEFVLFLPVGDHYTKPDMLSAAERVEMLRQVVSSNLRFKLSTVEVEASILLNTIDSLRLIQKEYPEHEISFLMGTDNLLQLPSWEGAKELLEEFSIYVVNRNNQNIAEILEKSHLLYFHRDKFHEVNGIIRNDISSTIIRQMIREGKSIRYLVPDVLHSHLSNTGLYQK